MVMNATASEAVGAITFMIMGGGSNTVPINLNYATVDGTASSIAPTDDFTAATGSLVIPPGDIFPHFVTVFLTNDTVNEGGDESFTLSITGDETGSAQGTIEDDDGTVTDMTDMTDPPTDPTDPTDPPTDPTDPIGPPDPTATDDYYVIPFDTKLSATAPGILANDFDDDPLVAVIDSLPANGILKRPDGALLSVGDQFDGAFDYAHNAGFIGTDSYTYHATDGTAVSNVATVQICSRPRHGHVS